MTKVEECFPVRNDSCVFDWLFFWFYEANLPKLITITRNKRLRRWFDNPLLHPGIFDGGSHDFSRAPWVVSRFLFPPKMTLNVSLFVDGSNWISLSFFRDHSKFRFPSSLTSHSKVSKTQHPARIGASNPLGDWCEWKNLSVFHSPDRRQGLGRWNRDGQIPLEETPVHGSNAGWIPWVNSFYI